MRVGYCSPFNPMKSGISDFSEELVPELCKLIEVVVFSPIRPKHANVMEPAEIHLLSELDDDQLRNSLDLIVYHVGNNIKYHGEIIDMLLKYGGILELHDFGLHHLAAEKYWITGGNEPYLNEVIYCHGERGARIAQQFFNGEIRGPWEIHSMDMPMNRRYIEAADAMIVHSETAKQMALGIRPDIPIVNIMLHADIIDNPDIWKNECRVELNIAPDTIVFGSFGFATSAKRIVPILDALTLYKKRSAGKFLYLIVGEPQKELKLDEAISERGLDGNVMVTGFATLEEFKRYMGACDFCFNLRYPTQGESSASLHRMLGMGKPVIVTDIGTFADYPDEVVLKVRYDDNEVNDILQAIYRLTDDRNAMKKRSEMALTFAKQNCSLQTNSTRYYDYFQQICDHTWEPDYEDVILGRLCELGLTSEDYVGHFQQFLDVV